MKRRNWQLGILAILLVVMAYPACVLGYTWVKVLRSPLPGGRDGPLDAYRHTLASALVAYSAGPAAVDLATQLLEFRDKSSSRMDRHNNHIGAVIGSHVARFADLEPTVRAQVLRGDVNATNTDQITWLPAAFWRDGRFW